LITPKQSKNKDMPRKFKNHVSTIMGTLLDWSLLEFEISIAGWVNQQLAT
jgi:hypothetical protein